MNYSTDKTGRNRIAVNMLSWLTCGIFLLIILLVRLFSGSFTFAVVIETAVIAAGLWFLNDFLSNYFNGRIRLLILIVILFGTNYFGAAGVAPVSPSILLFTLYSVLLWLSLHWHEQPRLMFAVPLGIIAGLVILVSPVHVVALIIPLFWNVYDTESLKNKLNFFKEQRTHLILIVFCILAVVSPLLFAWDFVNGIFHPYGFEKEGRMFFIARYFWQVLFSYGYGWFIYTPVMILALTGLYFLAEKTPKLYYSVFGSVLAGFLYIAGSTTWNAQTGPGFTPLIPFYAALSLPLGYLLIAVLDKGYLVRIPFFLIVAGCILLNLFQTWQFSHAIIDPPQMTGEYYWSVFGSNRATFTDKLKMEDYHPNPDSLLKDSIEFTMKPGSFFSFSNTTADKNKDPLREMMMGGRMAFKLDKYRQFSPAYDKPFGKITKANIIGVRLTAWVYSNEPFSLNPSSLVIADVYNSKPINYKSLKLETLNLPTGKWSKVELNYFTLIDPDPADRIVTYVYYRGNKEMYVDDIRTKIFEPKE
jgi:hypothetical protein